MATTLMEIPEKGIGPAFDKLSAKRKAFVMHYVGQSRRNAARAYREAGYQPGNDNSARTNACLLLHRDDVQDAIREYCTKALVALAPVATEVAAEMLESPQTDPATRARLVLGVMDRVGMAVKTEHKVTVEHIGNDPSMIAEARKLVEALGLTPEQVEAMFGRTTAGKVVDVAYTDVTAEEPDRTRVALPAPEAAPERPYLPEDEVR
jgi:phage terminase small subunit